MKQRIARARGRAVSPTEFPESLYTVTVQIVTILVGDQAFDSATTLAAFAPGLVLFCI